MVRKNFSMGLNKDLIDQAMDELEQLCQKYDVLNDEKSSYSRFICLAKGIDKKVSVAADLQDGERRTMAVHVPKELQSQAIVPYVCDSIETEDTIIVFSQQLYDEISTYMRKFPDRRKIVFNLDLKTDN